MRCLRRHGKAIVDGLRQFYQSATRAEAYSKLEFSNTYHLAFRDLPEIFSAYVKGAAALDFGCGTGRDPVPPRAWV